MSTIDWSCPWCGRHPGVEEREFRTAASITCPECHTSVDLAPDPAPVRPPSPPPQGGKKAT